VLKAAQVAAELSRQEPELAEMTVRLRHVETRWSGQATITACPTNTGRVMIINVMEDGACRRL
jgi:hypothetical protein